MRLPCTLSAVALLWLAAPAPTALDAASDLAPVLRRLAARAELHKRLLYEFHCTEELTRSVQRRRESAAGFGFQPDQLRQARHGIVVGQDDASGVPIERRVKLRKSGAVALNRKGLPIEIELSPEFAPITRAIPHAQVAWFTAEDQEQLRFHPAGSPGDAAGRFRIECSGPDEIAVEFLDRELPRREGLASEPQCSARASGQMCLRPDGEISRIQFYAVYSEGPDCTWDRDVPFVSIEQNRVEKATGLRFPTRVRTVFPLNWRDTAIFDQRYGDCVFTHVRVGASLPDAGFASTPP